MLFTSPLIGKLEILQGFESERKCLELKDRVDLHSSLPSTPTSPLSPPPKQ